MDYGDYYWGLFRDYYGDPFPHSLLSRQCYPSGVRVLGFGALAWIIVELAPLVQSSGCCKSKEPLIP